jgi:arylsulfatase A-like enzyme
MTPFRGEKNTNWEGGWRVPAMVRWPGKIPAGAWTNEIVHHMDWLPTFVAAAGDPEVKERPEDGIPRRSAATTRSTSTATTSCRC